ncbi:MAG: hypothetical protein K0R14_1585 [Burkholderiales bacterium]|jgi:ABC-type uncharacterized transport system auxiliary subunit|nr:hypothetical protein [Burkholderiales bacterium]
MLRNIIKTSSLIFIVSGCGMFGPVTPPQIHTYQLEAVEHNELSAQCPANVSKEILQITNVKADAPYDSTNMYYSQGTYQVDSYALNQWVSLPAAMLTQAIQEKIMLSCKYASVVNAEFMTIAKYRLTNQVVNFKQIINKDKATFNMTVITHLVDNKTNQVIKGNTFDVSVPVAPSPKGYIDGANQAVAKFLGELLAWLK